MNLRKNNKLILLGLILFTAFFLRFLLVFNFGFEADISFWKSWGLGVFDHGIVWAAHNTNNNYPAPFAYFLGIMVGIYSLFADPHNFNEFWSNGNTLFLLVSKLPPILADFGIAGIIIWIGKNVVIPGQARNDKNTFFILLAIVYLLNPISIIDGAWWGQVDSLGVFVFLLAFAAALTKRPLLAGILFMAAMMTKLQNMIYGPIFFLFLWQYSGYDGLVKGLMGSALAFFGLNIEFMLARDMGRVVGSLTDNFDYFPLMSLNAYNLWWVVSGGHGMQVSDKFLTLGLINAKTMGLILFASVYLFAVLRQLFNSNIIVNLLNGYIVRKQPRRLQQVSNSDNLTIEDKQYKKNALQNFTESLILVNAAFFLFQTQSHDRYAYPLSAFLLLWAPFVVSDKKSKKLFFIFYATFSVIYFYNLHTALVANYPTNGLPLLSRLTQIPLTLAASVGLLVLYAVFLTAVMKRTHPLIYLTPLSVAVFAIIGLNLPLITKKPVTLTKLTPYVSEQGYGLRQTNMPVNAYQGFKYWSPLSDQYYFYQKGIGIHADSFINYDLGGHFRRFTTDYGIDTEAGDKGIAYFEIYGDGKKLFASDKIGRFDVPRHAEVDVTNVKTLGLVTRRGAGSIADDHTDWLNPILYP